MAEEEGLSILNCVLAVHFSFALRINNWSNVSHSFHQDTICSVLPDLNKSLLSTPWAMHFSANYWDCKTQHFSIFQNSEILCSEMLENVPTSCQMDLLALLWKWLKTVLICHLKFLVLLPQKHVENIKPVRYYRYKHSWKMFWLLIKVIWFCC